MLFDLPTLGPGETVSMADLEVFNSGKAPDGDGSLDINVAGLGLRSTATVNTTDFGEPSAVLSIVKNLVVGQDGATDALNGTYTTTNSSPDEDTTLGAYIQSLYAADPLAGSKFLVLRLDNGLDGSDDGNSDSFGQTDTAGNPEAAPGALVHLPWAITS